MLTALLGDFGLGRFVTSIIVELPNSRAMEYEGVSLFWPPVSNHLVSWQLRFCFLSGDEPGFYPPPTLCSTLVTHYWLRVPADSIGMRLAANACYDPSAAPR